MTQRLILRHGDCVEVLKGYEDGSIGAFCSDPPYGLEFMGKKWDRLQGYTADTGFKDFTLPRQRKRNVKCPECGKWVYDHHPRACVCGGVRRLQQSRMEAWHLQWLTEAFRVLRPGGVIKAFSGTRTFHRMTAAMQEAGFINLRVESWNYGSGFPKSLNIGKALDKAAGVEREVIAPATEASRLWDGWGTALKPSWEPVVVGRKP
jgi:site-specific DNA-methyltransferase (adenine-specific)